MVGFTRHYYAITDLLELSEKDNFKDLTSSDVYKTLERFALSRIGGEDDITKQYSAVIFARKEKIRSNECKIALMRIWELLLERYQSDLPNRQNWHKNISFCNALYEHYAGFYVGKELGSEELFNNN